MTEDLVYSFTTEKGLEIRVHPENPQDSGHLIDLFEHLGPQSRYFRFSTTLRDPEAVRREAERLARLEAPQEMAWLAFADLPGEPGAPIGGVRLAIIEPGVAEVAISVRDDLQRQGIGTELLAFALEQARAAGIDRIVANFLATNRAIWRLLRHSRFPTTIELHGSEVSAAIDLTAGQAG